MATEEPAPSQRELVAEASRPASTCPDRPRLRWQTSMVVRAPSSIHLVDCASSVLALTLRMMPTVRKRCRWRRRWATSSPTAGRTLQHHLKLAVRVNPAGGFNSYYWEMPRKQARLHQLENLADEVRGHQINYALTDVPEDMAYFHAQWRRSTPTLHAGSSCCWREGPGGHYVARDRLGRRGWWGEVDQVLHDGDDKWVSDW